VLGFGISKFFKSLEEKCLKIKYDRASTTALLIPKKKNKKKIYKYEGAYIYKWVTFSNYHPLLTFTY